MDVRSTASVDYILTILVVLPPRDGGAVYVAVQKYHVCDKHLVDVTTPRMAPMIRTSSV
jgi:hypothetical protein